MAVMALERVPADIRAQGGVARMSDPKMIKEIMDAVTIPVMAKARIGHFVEAQVCLRLPAIWLILQLLCFILTEHRRFSRRPGSTTSTSRRFSPQPMRFIMWRSIHSKFPLFVDAETLERH